ncbi:diguanylate cyclase [Vibrio orientalis CIP 102891 = ATCC 33934]|uniref:diguanylate cyclase n=1 Tax=Vibrio orientalis CIP 102891 = ATCC 33934 TaxID=675816 RepID=F9SSA9_VIBOR|nr:GGDEF domain-containing protein [Vibrio orientalis]EGU50741.1 diguanylate cyclase [Vibrio orientalis CIP 102891 = ATCC 33934]
MQYKAYTDSISGIANRLGVDEYLYRVLNQSESKAVLLLDIDKFKLINDTQGHLIGDELIKWVAINIERSVRKDMDFVGRYGGDEFIIILSRVDKYTSVKVAENIREKISSTCVPDSVSPAISSVTCSIGVVSFFGLSDRNTVVSTADAALYQAKRDGRNCVRSKSLNG